MIDPFGSNRGASPACVGKWIPKLALLIVTDVQLGNALICGSRAGSRLCDACLGLVDSQAR